MQPSKEMSGEKFSSSKYISSIQRVKRVRPKAGQTSIYKPLQRIEPLGTKKLPARANRTRRLDRPDATTASGRTCATTPKAKPDAVLEMTGRVTPGVRLESNKGLESDFVDRTRPVARDRTRHRV
jgi:hypothetical protein